MTENQTGQHTPEPWTALDDAPDDELGGYVVTDKRDGAMIADCNILLNGRGDECNRANHLRIVACVNALQGIPDPARYRLMADRAIIYAEAMEAYSLFEGDDGNPFLDAISAARKNYRAAKGEQ